MEKVEGFKPYFDGESRVLILGSFPSVKSRAQNFYYGNPRNAFWEILANFFKEPVPADVAEKKRFLTRHNVALWDVVTQCEIVASRDETIKNFTVADLNFVLQNSKVKYILVNGGKAWAIFSKYYKDIAVPADKLPSTSPANTRRNEEEWYDALRRAFG